MMNLLVVVIASNFSNQVFHAMKHSDAIGAVVSPPIQEVVQYFNAVFLDDREYYYPKHRNKNNKIFTPLRKVAQRTKVSSMQRCRGNVFRNH